MKVHDGAFLKTLVRISKIPAKIKCVQSMIYVTFTEIQSIIILISDLKNGRKKERSFIIRQDKIRIVQYLVLLSWHSDFCPEQIIVSCKKNSHPSCDFLPQKVHG